MGTEAPSLSFSHRNQYELRAKDLDLQPVQGGLFMDVTDIEYTGYGMDQPQGITQDVSSWVSKVGTYDSNSRVLVFIDGVGHKWIGAANDQNREALRSAGYQQGSIYVELCDGRYPSDEKLNAQYEAVIKNDQEKLRALLKEDADKFVTKHRVQYDIALKQASDYSRDPVYIDRGVQVTKDNIGQFDGRSDVAIMYGKGDPDLEIQGQTLTNTLANVATEIPIADPIVFAFQDRFIGLPRDNAPRYETTGLEELTHKLQSGQALNLAEIGDLRLLLKLGVPHGYPWIDRGLGISTTGTIGRYPEEILEHDSVDKYGAEYMNVTRQVVRALQEAVMYSNPDLLRDREISCLIADLIKSTILSGESLPKTIRDAGHNILKHMLSQEKLPEVINIAGIRAVELLVLFPDTITSVSDDTFVNVLQLAEKKVEIALIQNKKYDSPRGHFWIQNFLWGGNENWEKIAELMIQKSTELQGKANLSDKEKIVLNTTTRIVSTVTTRKEFDDNSWFIRQTTDLV